MKNLLKIFLISSSLCACSSMTGDRAANEGDSANTNTAMPPDSALHNEHSSANFPDPSDMEKENIRQITSALLSSQQEIVSLRSEISESLSKPGLTDERELLFRKTILELEKSSDLVNKQLEKILVSDLQNSREKLNGIVRNMKVSEKELGSMIVRLDRITNYMQIASGLMQAILPIPATPVPAKSSKEK